MPVCILALGEKTRMTLAAGRPAVVVLVKRLTPVAAQVSQPAGRGLWMAISPAGRNAGTLEGT